MRGPRLIVAVMLALAACGHAATDDTHPPVAVPARAAASHVTLSFVGDVMLGRGVGDIVRWDPESIFADVAFVLSDSDIAVGNLESPLTRRPHTDPNPNALEAVPAAAGLLADAGFNAVTIANNHAGDAGQAGTRDTVRALGRVGVGVVGGRDPIVYVTSNGLTAAALAFDTSGETAPGIQAWSPRRAHRLVATARRHADIVTVALHGGMEYRPTRDPWLARAGALLARWGADVVWCHGPHVVQPVRVIDPDDDGRATVVATSLGNFVFDQAAPRTRTGAILQVRATADGVVAWREARTTDADLRVHLRHWLHPRGDAVVLDGTWWALSRAMPPLAGTVRPTTLPTFPGDAWTVTAAARGDVNGDGQDEVVVSYRWPYAPVPLSLHATDVRWIDANGMAAHLGVYRGRDLAPIWVASAIVRPVARLHPCGDGLLVAYSTLDAPRVVATGWWPWSDPGFLGTHDLPGPARLGCTDVDGDGTADPVAIERTPR